jgi:glycine hydroxymethyltransferase
LQPEFKAYQKQIVRNAKALAAALEKLGYRIVSGGTDNHLFMVDLRPKNITGKEAAILLDKVRITVNKNLIPFDPQPPTVTSGIRVGTPALTTRGMKEADMETVAKLMDQAIVNRNDPAALEKVLAGVRQLTAKFPIYQGLMQ